MDVRRRVRLTALNSSDSRYRARQRVGADLVNVSDIAASISRFGDRYLDRIYTPLELAQTQSTAERIAARFAGKEAVMKILRPSRSDAVPFLDIEIATLPSGAPHVRLRRSALDRARHEHLGNLTVSLSHDAGLAFAVASGLCSRRKDPRMTIDTVRSVVDRYGNLKAPVAELTDEQDLYEAGLTSHASVNVMLALEDETEVEFPDELLTRSTFASIASIASVIDSLVKA